MKYTEKNLRKVIEESNAIEMVYNEQSIEDSISAFKYLMEHDNITTHHVKTAHKILMTNQPLYQGYKGDFRSEPVTIGGVTKRLSKIILESLMVDLLSDMNEGKNKEDCIMHHVQFEGIHPFMDGNGRLGRLLLNWESVKKFNGDLFYFKESEKEKYYGMFR